MKVTKRIEEYVNKSVNEIFMPRINELKESIRKEEAEANEMLTQLIKQYNEELTSYMKINYPCIYPSGYSLEAEYLRNYSCEVYRGDENRDMRLVEITDLERRRQNKIDNILVALELGAGKDELDKMLKEISI